MNLTPFSVDPSWNGTADEFDVAATIPHNSDDIIYGGWGSDWLHGGSGDDAISGAEALAGAEALSDFYGNPHNLGNVLAYSTITGTFAEYLEFTPLERIVGFLLNFNAGEGLRASRHGGTQRNTAPCMRRQTTVSLAIRATTGWWGVQGATTSTAAGAMTS